MSTVRETLQGVLDRSVEEDEWDLAPTLAVILQEDDVTLDPIPIDGSGWAAAPPFQVIQAVAESMREVHQAVGWSPFPKGTNLLGVVLFSEGWGVSETTPEAVRVLNAWLGEGHRLSEHPLAVEFKMVHAVLTDDSQVSLMYGRGDKPYSDEAASAVEGRIPDALRELVGVLRGMVSA